MYSFFSNLPPNLLASFALFEKGRKEGERENLLNLFRSGVVATTKPSAKSKWRVRRASELVNAGGRTIIQQSGIPVADFCCIALGHSEGERVTDDHHGVGSRIHWPVTTEQYTHTSPWRQKIDKRYVVVNLAKLRGNVSSHHPWAATAAVAPPKKHYTGFWSTRCNF